MIGLINFNENFNPPLPFTLHSKFGDFSSLEGDSIYINIYGKGDIPAKNIISIP